MREKTFMEEYLGECFVNGESLSRYLVREGFAFAYRKYSDKFILDEEYAKSNRHVVYEISISMGLPKK